MLPHSRIGGHALTALLPDLHAAPGPVYVALARAVVTLVQDGRIATETRLPSERDLAAALRVSRATVTAAYDRLRAEGYLASRTGAGSFVTVPAGSTPHRMLSRWTSATPHLDVIDLSCAALAAPDGLLPEAYAAAAARLPIHLSGDGYEPAGLPELRARIAERFAARGVPTRPDQILITNGALHGIDLIARLLVGPGDRVITELPTYPGALDTFRSAAARIMPVALDPAGGWAVDQLRATLRQSAARLAFLVPDFHNPTGALVPAADRSAVLTAARHSGTTVVVDESFVELGFVAPEPACAALAADVITLGSLSKPIWGGLRIGWIRASTDLVQRLAALRTSLDMGGPIVEQLVATDLVDQLDDVAAARVAQLRPRRDALLAALAKHLPDWRIVPPQGGLSLWAELPAPLSTPLASFAAQAGVIAVPGPRFGVDGTLERFLRIPFSLPSDRLELAVARLAEVWAQLADSGAATRRLVVA